MVARCSLILFDVVLWSVITRLIFYPFKVSHLRKTRSTPKHSICIRTLYWPITMAAGTTQTTWMKPSESWVNIFRQIETGSTVVLHSEKTKKTTQHSFQSVSYFLVFDAGMGRLHHKCNRLRLLATCSITITNKQNHNVINYD